MKSIVYCTMWNAKIFVDCFAYIKRACENKHAKTQVMMRENFGILREIVKRLTSMAKYLTQNTNGPDK